MNPVQSFDKINKSVRLRFQTPKNLGILNTTLRIENFLNQRNKHALRIDEGLAIPKHQFQFLNRTQRSPNSRRQSDETDRAHAKAFREFQHINEILEHARHAAVVFRCDNDQSVGIDHGLRKEVEFGRFD